MPRALDVLPALYRALLSDLLERPLPEETKATCARCVMAEPGPARSGGSLPVLDRVFRTDTKCCTYHPQLPNYLVGAALSDEGAGGTEGRQRLEARIASRVGVTPQWLLPPARFQAIYAEDAAAFGRSAALRCPFFLEADGTCSVWAFREAVCSTYFCRYAGGADGRQVWTALKRYLLLVENQLSRYALSCLLPGYERGGSLRHKEEDNLRTAGELPEGPLPEDAYRVLWHGHAGREAELYRETWAQVRALSPAQVQDLLGLSGMTEEARLAQALDVVDGPPLPPALRFNPGARSRALPDGSVVLGSYDVFDGVVVPAAAAQALAQVLEPETLEGLRVRLVQSCGAALAEELLVELYRQRVLVPGER